MSAAASSRRSVLVRRYAPVLGVVALAALLVAVVPSASSPRTSTPGRAAVTPALQPGSAGRTVSGRRCAPGVRQVAWSHYAPICVPAWSGHNGGSTSPGVTARTVTVTWRLYPASGQASLGSLVPSADLGTPAEQLATARAFVTTFNRTFELYGRHVVLVPYTGRGDPVAELTGQGQAAAATDAATARRLGAFADSSAWASTPAYEQALAAEHVVGLSLYPVPDDVLAAAAPFAYSTAPVCSKTAAATAALVGRSLARTPVAFGAVASDGQTRVFGLVEAGSTDQQACAAGIASALERQDGVTPAITVRVGDDPASLGSQVDRAVAQLQAAGVTTVLCSTCDAVVAPALTREATMDHYRPEWVQADGPDALGALLDPLQAPRSLSLGVPAAPITRGEVHQAFVLGHPGRSQPAPDAAQLYEPLLLLFDALQQAGPDLTPATFARGLESLPASVPGGVFGGWAFAAGTHDPSADAAVLQWQRLTPSPGSGQPGTWTACNGGTLYPYSGAPPQLPAGAQVLCGGSVSTTAASLGRAGWGPPAVTVACVVAGRSGSPCSSALASTASGSSAPSSSAPGSSAPSSKARSLRRERTSTTA